MSDSHPAGLHKQLLAPAIDQQLKQVYLRYDPLVTGPVLEYFDPEYPSSQARPVASGGRAAAWFITLGTREGVLRHFRRGGLMARIIERSYFWTGLSKTRSFAEFELLRLMWQRGLPVPRPLAAAVWRAGASYRAALITERIAGAQPLALCSNPAVWKCAGRSIAQMHACGVWHADLNVYNLLVDAKNKVWLIDLDRGRQTRLTAVQRAENLSRLLRSLRKVVPELESPCWPALKQGYQEIVSGSS